MKESRGEESKGKEGRNTNARLGVIPWKEGMERCFLGAGRTGQCILQVKKHKHKHKHKYKYK